MRRIVVTLLGLGIFLSNSQCDKSAATGHLKVSVTFPQAVVVPNQPVHFIQVPGVGAEVRLYNKDAVCLGYKDAMLNIVKVDGEYTTSLYNLRTNENGEVFFEHIPEGEYFLIVYAGDLYKYSEKYIKVIGGETIALNKNFTDDGAFIMKLEPWDHEVPGT